MTDEAELFDPGAGYIVTASYDWENFNSAILTRFYQPILGPTAFSMFYVLKNELKKRPLLSGRNMQSHLLIQLNAGRGAASEAIRRLEAVGLLRTFTQVDQLGVVYVYEVQPTLTPKDFIEDDLLSILLLSEVGEERFNELREYANRYRLETPDRKLTEITHNFLDVFHVGEREIVNLPGEIKKAKETFQPSPEKKEHFSNLTNFSWETLIQLLHSQPITTDDLENNRELIAVEHQLYGIDEPTMAKIITQSADLVTNKIRPNKLKQIVANGYRIDAKEQLQQGTPEKEKLETQSGLTDEEEKLLAACDYYAPITFLQQLKQQTGGFVTSGERNIIRNFIQEQKMNSGVVNLLSWYVIASLSKPTLQANYVNTIANNWLRAGVKNSRDALQEIQKFTQSKEEKTVPRRNKKASRRREELPEWSKNTQKRTERSTPEEIKELRERIANRSKKLRKE